MRVRRRIGVWLVSGVAAAGFFVAPALAETADDGPSQGILEIPLGTVVSADPDSLKVLAEVDVPGDLRGRSCDVQSQAENNSSVHPDNDLLVASDGTAIELLDVEATPGKVTSSLDRLVLGPSVRVTLRMGPDGVFSAGSTLVVLDCPQPTTTTTEPPSSTTSEPPSSSTSEPPSSTTSEPPASTTSEPPASTTSSTTTTAPPSTTPSTTTSTAPPTTTVPFGGPDLPVTGPGTVLVLAGAAVALLDLGYLTLSATRPRRRRRP